jgi:predicted dehydrogenase
VTQADRTLPPSSVPPPDEAPTLNWGILAPGHIAHVFTRALKTHTRQHVVSVGSRSLAKATAFASEFGVESAFGSYRELVEDAKVDVVYIASPISEHYSQALLAIEAGKHVLVEKAFTRNAREAEDLIAAARRRGMFLMEALWMRFLPHIDVVHQAVESGLLGDVQTVSADHGQLMRPDINRRLFAPELAGGALLDLGIYPLSFASLVLGPFATITAVGRKTSTGVDGQASIVVTNAAGAHGLLGTTLFTRTPTTASICGTDARLELDSDFYPPTTVRLIGNDGTQLDAFESRRGSAGHAFQAAELARCVKAGRVESAVLPHVETMRVMQSLDTVRDQIGVRFPDE